MVLPIADASAEELLVPAGAALLGVLIGALVPFFLEWWMGARRRYDDAITAVTRLQAARHGAGVDVPEEYVKPAAEGEMEKVKQELSVEGVRRFLDAAAESRAALAALYPYSPDLQEYWDRFEVPGAQLDVLVNTLTKRRRRPMKKYGGEDLAK